MAEFIQLSRRLRPAAASTDLARQCAVVTAIPYDLDVAVAVANLFRVSDSDG